jgi:hypothetical protein
MHRLAVIPCTCRAPRLRGRSGARNQRTRAAAVPGSSQRARSTPSIALSKLAKQRVYVEITINQALSLKIIFSHLRAIERAPALSAGNISSAYLALDLLVTLTLLVNLLRFSQLLTPALL